MAEEDGRKIAEEGADIIMGHHSHTLQAFEIIGSTQVFYGLGSLAFGDFEKNGKNVRTFPKDKAFSAILYRPKPQTAGGCCNSRTQRQLYSSWQ
ncbi:MAG: CapA family protein [Bacteroidales bacterium]|nr:CapA family protein [Bacteroidales bacterium]